MGLVIGISDDAYDSGATLADGERIIFAANEERYTRYKTQGGFPFESLTKILEKVDPRQVEHVCVSGIMTPPLAKRLAPKMQRWLDSQKVSKTNDGSGIGSRVLDFLIHETPIAHTRPGSAVPRFVQPNLPNVIRRLLPPELAHTKIHIVEHHRAHAASAWFLSGFGPSLVLTGDGMGDGVSLSVSRASKSGIERLWTVPSRSSFGLFYEMVTRAFGFIPCRHEGKVTGLAACGDPLVIDEPSPFYFEDDELKYDGPRGRSGVDWISGLVQKHGRENVAAWAQLHLESHVVAIARRWLRKTNLSRVCLAGGIFANVKLNQQIHELDECDGLFVCPNMGDGGLSLGAIAHSGFLEPRSVEDVFFGDGFSDDEIERALRKEGLQYERHDQIHEPIADALAEGKLVARFVGRMEWGPRALGNRTVLAPTTDRSHVRRLNKLLGRNDFMPFAPAALEEDMDRYALNWQSAARAAEFMTTTFRCTEHMAATHPAVVHVDGTARTQLVRAATNPRFHEVLTAYKRRTGHGILLNTSFNIHEEPIIRTPEQAIRGFLGAQLDYLAVGPFWVPAAHLRAEADTSREAAHA